jgi:hypothetical protein
VSAGRRGCMAGNQVWNRYSVRRLAQGDVKTIGLTELAIPL